MLLKNLAINDGYKLMRYI